MPLWFFRNAPQPPDQRRRLQQRLPIFDGKLRYDLVLSPKGTHAISGVGKLRGTAYVCRAFVPIAGHKGGERLRIPKRGIKIACTMPEAV